MGRGLLRNIELDLLEAVHFNGKLPEPLRRRAWQRLNKKLGNTDVVREDGITVTYEHGKLSLVNLPPRVEMPEDLKEAFRRKEE